MRAVKGVGVRLDRDSFPHYLRIAIQLLTERLTTWVSMGYAAWWGIDLGEGNTFVGLPSFSRARGSRISIGPRGRFLSMTTSNRHGLNRPCMISTLKPGAEIAIGERVGLSGVVICAATKVIIGDRVMIGANSTVTDTDSHPVHFANRHPDRHGRPANAVVNAVETAAVVFEDDVFIGMNTLVLKGVRIGKGSVIGAGSVVVKSVPAWSIAAGNPARVIRALEDRDLTVGSHERDGAAV